MKLKTILQIRGVRFGIAVLLFLLGSFVIFSFITQFTFRESREKVALVMAHIAETEMRNAKWEPQPMSQRLALSLQYLGFELWMLEENGAIVTSSESRPLILPWEEIEKPDTEYEPQWTRIGLKSTVLASIKLMSVPPRYVVMYFNPARSSLAIGKILVFLFALWFGAGIHLLSRHFYGPRFSGLNRSGRAGMSLIAVMLTVGILALSMTAVTSLLKISTKNSARSDLRLAIRSLADTVKETVDCEKTFEGLNLSTTCSYSNFTGIVLKTSKGTPLTSVPLKPGTFNAEDTGLNGSGSIGGFLLRAHCKLPDNILYVHFAKLNNQGKIMQDPLLNRPYDFKNESVNPLFGAADRVLCRGAVSATAPPGLDCEQTPWVTNMLDPQNSVAKCVSPRKIISGGCKINGGSPTDQDLTMSYPNPALNGWACQSSNEGRPTAATAICCK